MLETFLILLSGGVMLAAAIPNPRDVTLHWLRLAGIIALTLIALGGFFMWRRETGTIPIGNWIAWSLASVCVMAQLGFTQTGWRRTQRVFAVAAMMLAVSCVMTQPTSSMLVSSVGLAAMCGIALMDMLLGHAYLTASQMTMKPFGRLNTALAITLMVRTLCAVGLVLVLQAMYPVPRLWGIYGLLIGTRWFVGLLVAGIFVYMAHDCIKRRATQSATGILYVAGVLIFLGEIIALQLVRETGLPF